MFFSLFFLFNALFFSLVFGTVQIQNKKRKICAVLPFPHMKQKSISARELELLRDVWHLAD